MSAMTANPTRRLPEDIEDPGGPNPIVSPLNPVRVDVVLEGVSVSLALNVEVGTREAVGGGVRVEVPVAEPV